MIPTGDYFIDEYPEFFGIDLAVPNKHRYKRKGGPVQLKLDFEPKKSWFKTYSTNPYMNASKQWISVYFSAIENKVLTHYMAEWK